jgi:hypothetical protein
MNQAKGFLRPAVGADVFNELGAQVLWRDHYTCQVCGATAEDRSPSNPGKAVRLTIGYITERPKGSRDVLGNLRTECADCKEGLRTIPLPKLPPVIELFKQIRRATLDDQRAVFEWLKEKFKTRDAADS